MKNENLYPLVGVYYAKSARIIQFLIRHLWLQSRITPKLRLETFQSVNYHNEIYTGVSVTVRWFGRKLGVIASGCSKELKQELEHGNLYTVKLVSFKPANFTFGLQTDDIEPRIQWFGYNGKADRAVVEIIPQ